MLNKIEEHGPYCGKLLDSQLFIYEIKNIHPPIRLYFKHNQATDEIYVFEFEMKSSEDKQQRTIEKIKSKAKELKSYILSTIFLPLQILSSNSSNLL